jgi:hypothetical protein
LWRAGKPTEITQEDKLLLVESLATRAKGMLDEKGEDWVNTRASALIPGITPSLARDILMGKTGLAPAVRPTGKTAEQIQKEAAPKHKRPQPGDVINGMKFTGPSNPTDADLKNSKYWVNP